MINIQQKLRAIQEYYEVTRRVGHTTGMLEGANHTDNALILTHNMKMGEEIKKKFGSPSSVTVQSIHTNSILRGYCKPLFIDNAAIYVLIREALAKIETLERENKHLYEKLQAIDDVDDDYDFE